MAAAYWLGAEFPYGTLIANLSGAFVIGVVQQVGSDTLLLPERIRLVGDTVILVHQLAPMDENVDVD